MGLIYSLLVGALCGWLAGQFFKGHGFGLLGNIVIGLIGGLIGGWLAGILGIGGGGLLWRIIISVLGAGLLLYLIGLIKKR